MDLIFVAVQEVTITKTTYKGSNRIAYNYDLDGKPFGQVATFKASGEVHPFTAVRCNGSLIGQYNTFKAADKAIRGEM